MRACILCHYAGQSASVALSMYRALQKADSSLASLCSGPETGLARWVRIKKTIGKADFIFHRGSFSLIGGSVIQVNNNLFVKRVFHTICSKAHKRIDKTFSNVTTYI